MINLTKYLNDVQKHMQKKVELEVPNKNTIMYSNFRCSIVQVSDEIYW